MNVRSELLPKPVHPSDLERAVQLFHAIADKHWNRVSEGLDELVAEYNRLTSDNLSVEDTKRFQRIDFGMDVEEYVELALRPVPRVSDVTDEELLEIISEVQTGRMTVAKLYYWETFLEINIPSSKVLNLLFSSKEELTPEQILAKAREWNPIVLYPPGSSS